MKITQFKASVEFELAMHGDARVDWLKGRIAAEIQGAIAKITQDHRMFSDNLKVKLDRTEEAQK